MSEYEWIENFILEIYLPTYYKAHQIYYSKQNPFPFLYLENKNAIFEAFIPKKWPFLSTESRVNDMIIMMPFSKSMDGNIEVCLSSVQFRTLTLLQHSFNQIPTRRVASCSSSIIINK